MFSGFRTSVVGDICRFLFSVVGSCLRLSVSSRFSAVGLLFCALQWSNIGARLSVYFLLSGFCCVFVSPLSVVLNSLLSGVGSR